MSGGGDKLSVILPLGIMMLWLGIVSLFMHVFRQSNIVAALIIGLIVGGSGLDDLMQLEEEIKITFIELGNVLVLFFAGLSTDWSSLATYRREIWLISIIQFTSYIGIFAGIGYGIHVAHNAVSCLYFGLACTMSSTVLVKNYLGYWGEETQLHGKLLYGVMILQDTLAAISFVIIEAFKRIKQGSIQIDVFEQNVPMSELFDMDRAGLEIGRAIGIMFALLTILFGLKRFVLDQVFRYFRKEEEMLFIGAMAYNFGISALCQLVGFSPFAGAYFAGLNLSFLSTRAHIESKISSLRAFGMTNFYFMLGVYVQLDGPSFGRLIPWSILLAAIVSFGMPMIWFFFTRYMGLKGRTRFFIACTNNSMGEFSLIIQNLCFNAHIFDRDIHIVLLFASIITMVITPITQHLKHPVYRYLGSWYTMDKGSAASVELEHEFTCKDHVVLLGLNEVGKEIADFFHHKEREVAMIDLDPELHRALLKQYTDNKGKRFKLDPFDGGHSDENLRTASSNASGLASPERIVQREGSSANGSNGHDRVQRAASAANSVSSNAEGRSFRSGVGLSSLSGRSALYGASRKALPFLFGKYTLPVGTNILPIYSDPQKPIVWERYHLKEALLVVSCLEEHDLTELRKFCHENNVPFISTADRKSRAKHTIDLQADYVVYDHFLAARRLQHLLKAQINAPKGNMFSSEAVEHRKMLEEETKCRHRKRIAEI